MLRFIALLSLFHVVQTNFIQVSPAQPQYFAPQKSFRIQNNVQSSPNQYSSSHFNLASGPNNFVQQQSFHQNQPSPPVTSKNRASGNFYQSSNQQHTPVASYQVASKPQYTRSQVRPPTEYLRPPPPPRYSRPPQPKAVAPPKQYVQPKPQYIQPPPKYIRPPPKYVRPPPQYIRPPPQYIRPPPQYVRPKPPPPPKCYKNQYGYKCCNKKLEQLMTDLMNQPENKEKWKKCNLQKQATDMQKPIEEEFDHSFESIIGQGEFVAKGRFKGDLMCKTKSPDGKVVLMYAHPEQYSVGSSERRRLTPEEIAAKGWTAAQNEIEEF